jgi:hypothetical protein
VIWRGTFRPGFKLGHYQEFPPFAFASGRGYTGLRAMKIFFVLMFSFVAAATTMAGEAGFKMGNIVLYQPNEVLQERLTDAKGLAEYVQALDKVCTEYFAKEVKAETLQVVVALKPGKLARVWFVSSTREDVKALALLREKLEKVPAIDVYKGPVAFALTGDIAGGGKSKEKGKAQGKEDGEFSPPIPKEWQDAVAKAKERKDGPVIVPDGFLAAVWPDEPGAKVKEKPVPKGFVRQELKPTGGNILRPKDWRLVEGHRDHVFMWTISKEDSVKGNYITGVRIQMLMDIKKNTGKTPQEFIEGFIAGKKKAAGKVVKECDASEQGIFTRVCLEMEEGPNHILYSAFWSSESADIAVISISGTTKELWKEMTATFDTMNTFELLDMKKLEEADKAKQQK